MLRLRGEGRFALLTASLSMTIILWRRASALAWTAEAAVATRFVIPGGFACSGH
jgi:hypothetical protein